MKNKVIIAIDPSYENTGIAIYYKGKISLREFSSKKKVFKRKQRTPIVECH